MILHGDCLVEMAKMEANSVDTIITDPPYGLWFMGKDWDRLNIDGKQMAMQEWHYLWAEKALRVAKPGAILMAFGGTRTFHRLACAIEDAGWEIRDTICWIYGQGFPKSHNFGCKCNERTEQKTECDMRPLRKADVPPSGSPQIEQGEVLLKGVSQQGISITERSEFRPSEIRSIESGVEGRGDVLSQTRELQADQVCPLPDGLSLNVSQGRVCDGASLDNGNGNGKAVIEDGGGTSQESRPTGQPNRKSRGIRKQSGTQESRGDICPKCGGLLAFRGYGSALKPSFEPIIIAMKPLDGTFAENAQKWGTGAINVDGCRVGIDGGTKRSHQSEFQNEGIPGKIHATRGYRTGHEVLEIQKGRWPANLILSWPEDEYELRDDITPNQLKELAEWMDAKA